MDNVISFPSLLVGFEQDVSRIRRMNTRSGRINNILEGTYTVQEHHRNCGRCGCTGHVHGARNLELLHLPFGGELTTIRFPRTRFICPLCGATWMQDVGIKAEGHFITSQLEVFACSLLEKGLTLKMVSSLTGLGRNTVKEIDKKRLEDRYTTLEADGSRSLAKPERRTRAIGIDEFKLHDGHVYATIIIDLETGHVLWLAHGKKKQAVLDFIDHVGKDWFDTVEAVACDMNSNYQDVFEEEFDHIQVVYDHFHIVKNFNEKVVAEVRKDEQRRLYAQGDKKAAKALKKTKYILCSKRETLQKKDKAASDGKTIVHEGRLFPRNEVKASGGKESRYDELIRDNKLLFTLDLVKESLDEAYKTKDEAEMSELVCEMIDTCRQTGNKHFKWFARLLENHFEGIIAHASLTYSSGKVEGTNNMIKTVRRQAYGYRDDEYFFLKLFDASRRDKAINSKSHRKSD